MFFLYIQYYMHFYEIWCFLKSRYIWNRQQCGDNSSIYVKRYLFWFCGMYSWVIYTGWDGDQDGESPDSGIWMACYQVWWYEIGCCMLVVGTGVVLRRDGRVGDVVLDTVVRRGEGWWMLSDRSKSWRADGDSPVDYDLKFDTSGSSEKVPFIGQQLRWCVKNNYYFIYRVRNEIACCRMKFTLRW